MKQTHPDNVEEALAMLKQCVDESAFKDWTVTDQMKDSLFQAIEQETTVATMSKKRSTRKISKISLVACAVITLLFVPPLFRSSQFNSNAINKPTYTANSASSSVQNKHTPTTSAVAETEKQTKQIDQGQQNGQKLNPSIRDKVKQQSPYSNTYSDANTGQRKDIVGNQETVAKPKQTVTVTSGTVPTTEPANKKKLTDDTHTANNNNPDNRSLQPIGTVSSNSVLGNTVANNGVAKIDPTKLQQLVIFSGHDVVVAGQSQNGFVKLYKVASNQKNYFALLAHHTIGIYVVPSQEIPMQLTDSEWQAVVQSNKLNVLPMYKAVATNTLPNDAISVDPEDPILLAIQNLYARHNLYGVHLQNGSILLLKSKQNQLLHARMIISAWPDPNIELVAKISVPILYFQPAFSQLSWADMQTHITWLTLSNQVLQQWNT